MIMQHVELPDLLREHAAAGRAYLEFLRVPALSMGVYRLPAGGEDPQAPHAEDEVYCVLEGRATVRVGEEERAVEPGSVVYVPAGVPHRFTAIREALALLVFFAPAESTGS
jgi:mannose-6-phosphate isomerase-like protein (cupin superfamily)